MALPDLQMLVEHFDSDNMSCSLGHKNREHPFNKTFPKALPDLQMLVEHFDSDNMSCSLGHKNREHPFNKTFPKALPDLQMLVEHFEAITCPIPWTTKIQSTQNHLRCR